MTSQDWSTTDSFEFTQDLSETQDLITEPFTTEELFEESSGTPEMEFPSTEPDSTWTPDSYTENTADTTEPLDLSQQSTEIQTTFVNSLGSKETSPMNSETTPSIDMEESSTMESGGEYSSTEAGDEYSSSETEEEYSSTESGFEYSSSETEEEYSSTDSGVEYSSSETEEEYSSTDSGVEYSSSETEEEYSSTDSGVEYSSSETEEEYSSTEAGDEYSSSETEEEYSSTESGFEYSSSETEEEYSSTESGFEYSSSETEEEYSSTESGFEYSSSETEEEYSSTDSGAEYSSTESLVEGSSSKETKFTTDVTGFLASSSTEQSETDPLSFFTSPEGSDSITYFTEQLTDFTGWFLGWTCPLLPRDIVPCSMYIVLMIRIEWTYLFAICNFCIYVISWRLSSRGWVRKSYSRFQNI
jgi:hypothetical protein